MIRVLIVDDSALLRTMVSDLLAAEPGIEVVGVAQHGSIALRKVEELKPDVVTLDMDMPVMDGLATLNALMAIPKPPVVIMLSAHTRSGADLTFKALEAGAADYVTKPGPGSSDALEGAVAELAEKILALIGRRRLRTLPSYPAHPHPVQRRALALPDAERSFIGIGISTGGPPALTRLLAQLGPQSPPIAIVQHMPVAFVPAFAQRLNQCSGLAVRVAGDHEYVQPGECVIAPGDRHLEITKGVKGYLTRLNDQPRMSGHRPSADMLLLSVAAVAGPRGIGVVMTGMGRDGALGAAAIKRSGGKVIAQDEESCVVYGMPRAVVEDGSANSIVALDEIPRELARCLRERR